MLKIHCFLNKKTRLMFSKVLGCDLKSGKLITIERYIPETFVAMPASHDLHFL